MNPIPLEYTMTSPAETSVQSQVDALVREHARLTLQEKGIKSKIDRCREQARQLLAEQQTAKLEGKRHGSIQWVQPTVSTSYDSKAIEVLAEHDENLRLLLEPHRKTSTRSGYVKICQ